MEETWMNAKKMNGILVMTRDAMMRENIQRGNRIESNRIEQNVLHRYPASKRAVCERNETTDARGLIR